MIKANLFCFSLLLFLFFQLSTAQNCQPESRERVMLVGDSWSFFTFYYESYQLAFTKYGYPDISILGDRTAINGTRASGWNTPTYLDLIQMELDSHPDVDLIILCLGGNDMVASNGWRKSMNRAQRDSVFDRVRAHLEDIIDHINTVRPQIEMLLGGYDYMNFVESILNYPAGSTNPYESMWNTLENPDPSEVNIGLGELETRKIAIANNYPNVQYVNALGLNHYTYGYPDTLPVPPFGSFPPQQTPFPGQAPNYTPLNGGDIRFPSPQIAMGAIVPGFNLLPGFDCIHMNLDSYFNYADHQTQYALLDWIKGNPDHSMVSEGGNQDGWARSSGQLGVGSIQVGTDSSMDKTYGFLSFDTNSLVPGKQVSRASLFLMRDSLAGSNPFEMGLRLDIISGSWGVSPDVESGDITALADLENVGCIVTTATEDGYVVRLDLNNEALSYLNPDGLTQFRLVMPDSMVGRSSFMALLDGDATGRTEPPRLDVFYEIPTSTSPTPQPEALVIYPNPTEKMLFLHFQHQRPQKFAYFLRDMMGKMIYYDSEVSVQIGEPVSLDLSTLSSGVYLLHVQYDDKSWVKKIVKK